MSDIVIAGYLGFANSGDEVLLSIVLSQIKKRLPDRTVTVLSMRPRETSSKYGVRAIYRYDIFRMAREFSQSKVFLFGGGSLLQDATSRRSLYYYLFLLRMAKRYGMKTMLFSNGIGPLLRQSSRRRTKEVISDVDVITLRDHGSEVLLHEIGADQGDVTVTADTAFMLPDGISGRDASFAGVPCGVRYAVISVRGRGRSEGQFAKTVAALCRHLTEEYGIAPLFVPMQYPRDLRATERAARFAGVPAYIWRDTFSADDVRGVLGGAEIAVGMRLHMLIFAAVCGVPSMGISYDPKVESFCREAELPYVDVGADAETLCRAADEIMARREELSEKIMIKAIEMAARAERNAEMLAELFG